MPVRSTGGIEQDRQAEEAPIVETLDTELARAPRPKHPEFELILPEPDSDLEQGEELFEVVVDGKRRGLRSHDYAEIFSVPGLYEALFHDVLECQSPERVCDLLVDEIDNASAGNLTVLDLGAGNGLVAEEIAERLEPDSIVGIDILPEAAAAAERDRPELYDGYHVVDLTAMPAGARAELESTDFNCLTSVAALGFGDIPPQAFSEAYNLISEDGWIAFNIKDEFLAGNDDTGFSKLMRRMLSEGAIELRGQERYRHRLSMAGDPIHYVAMVGKKQAEIPEEWAAQAEEPT